LSIKAFFHRNGRLFSLSGIVSLRVGDARIGSFASIVYIISQITQGGVIMKKQWMVKPIVVIIASIGFVSLSNLVHAQAAHYGAKSQQNLAPTYNKDPLDYGMLSANKFTPKAITNQFRGGSCDNCVIRFGDAPPEQVQGYLTSINKDKETRNKLAGIMISTRGLNRVSEVIASSKQAMAESENFKLFIVMPEKKILINEEEFKVLQDQLPDTVSMVFLGDKATFTDAAFAMYVDEGVEAGVIDAKPMTNTQLQILGNKIEDKEIADLTIHIPSTVTDVGDFYDDYLDEVEGVRHFTLENASSAGIAFGEVKDFFNANKNSLRSVKLVANHPFDDDAAEAIEELSLAENLNKVTVSATDYSSKAKAAIAKLNVKKKIEGSAKSVASEPPKKSAKASDDAKPSLSDGKRMEMALTKNSNTSGGGLVDMIKHN
jgi:hypothetical protein